MQNHHVAPAHHGNDLLRVPLSNLGVVLVLALRDRGAVAGAVQSVVDALGQCKEFCVALDDEPASIEAGPAFVGQ